MKKIKVILALVILLILSINTVYAKWAYAFVVYNKNVYVISENKVDPELIGSVLGQVTKYSTREGTYSGNFSNEYPRGTKYYEIIGSDINKVIAVKDKNGTFIEAHYRHEYAGGRYDIQAILFYISGIILVFILAWMLARRKMKKLRA